MGKGELAMNFIHPTAYVDVMVKLGDNNYIGPFCHLTGELTVGDNNRLKVTVLLAHDPNIQIIGTRMVP